MILLHEPWCNRSKLILLHKIQCAHEHLHRRGPHGPPSRQDTGLMTSNKDANESLRNVPSKKRVKEPRITTGPLTPCPIKEWIGQWPAINWLHWCTCALVHCIGEDNTQKGPAKGHKNIWKDLEKRGGFVTPVHRISWKGAGQRHNHHYCIIVQPLSLHLRIKQIRLTCPAGIYYGWLYVGNWGMIKESWVVS